MGKSSVSGDQSLLDANLLSNEGGSNAIVLPGKKKVKGKKDSRKSAGKDSVKLSKTEQRKMKQLQQDEERKILQSKSIKILEKCKIWDGAYALLQSSGTIGQAETVRGKRRRAVLFSKAGLEISEDILPSKKKRSQDVYLDEEANVNLDSDQSHLEHPFDANDHVQKKSTGIDNFTPNHSFESAMESTTKSSMHSAIGSNELATSPEVARSLEDSGFRSNELATFPEVAKSSVDAGIGSKELATSAAVEAKDIATCMLQVETTPPSVSISCDIGQDKKLEVDGVDGLKRSCDNTVVQPNNDILKHMSAPIVVNVSRPTEVDETRKDLPIIMMEQEIMEAINEHSVVIICGETGCGKTTQVPQFLYEAGFGSRKYGNRKGTIGVTQPRRVAVLATAKRVSYELGLCLGKEVGFQVRHDKMIGDNCSVKFMTDGILLREVQSDFLLRRYSIIILDEAHERSLNTDILIGMLSRVIKLRQKLYIEQQEKLRSGVQVSSENIITELKLVLMSATLRVEDFISDKKLFNDTPPVIEVPVRQYPVTVHFARSTKEDYIGQAYRKVMAIHKKLPPGGILVFVTGQREVEFLCKKLRRASQQLAENSLRRETDNEMAVRSEVNLKDISEAFEVGGNFLDEQTDRFSSYEEDSENPETDSYPSDTDTDSDLEVDSEGIDIIKPEALEETGQVLDFLREPDNLCSLKAAFEALAGTSSNTNCKEDPSLPDFFGAEEHLHPKPTVRPLGALYVLPLYAMLPASAQLRVFEEVPEGERLVVIATNVAETSLTIPGIKYVVDTGKEKVKNYKYNSGIATYEVQWISKASASQRAGRAGRTGPGHCYRIYSAAAYGKDELFPEFSCPEISKIPVDGVVLLMKSMGIDKVANFPFPTRPETEALVEAEQCLKALEALDIQHRLTPLGKAMALYPVSPRHSRMLLTLIQIMKNQRDYTRANLVLGYAVAAAAALSFPSPFIMQFENHETVDDIKHAGKHDDEEMEYQMEKRKLKKAKAIAKEARSRFSNPSSDALTIAYALQLFELAENSFLFCKSSLLHLKTMEEMSKLRKQLLQLIFYQSKLNQEFSWNHGSIEEVELSWRKSSDKHPLLIREEELLGQAICAGWADRVAKRVRAVRLSSDNDRKVRAARYQSNASKDTVFLHRWSSVSQTAPEFVVYSELMCTKRPYMHGVTSVKPDWFVRYVSSLCSFSAPLTDPKPYYEPLSDQVLCWVSPTFGSNNWQLPLHCLPIKNDMLRVSVFACSLLEGNVLPCLRSCQLSLAAPPSTILRREALGQRRVGDLLNKLKVGSKTIDSRAMLREAWSKNPEFLHSEVQHWFQNKFHHLFGEIWVQMHREVLLEGHELFPKRARKDQKKVK